MIAVLPSLPGTVADRKSRGLAGNVVIPAGPFKGLRSVRRIVNSNQYKHCDHYARSSLMLLTDVTGYEQ